MTYTFTCSGRIECPNHDTPSINILFAVVVALTFFVLIFKNYLWCPTAVPTDGNDNAAAERPQPGKENDAVAIGDPQVNRPMEAGPQGDAAKDAQVAPGSKKRKRQLGMGGRKSARK